MSVAAKIVQCIFGAAEGTFQADHSVLSKQRPQPGGKVLGLSEEFQISLEATYRDRTRVGNDRWPLSAVSRRAA